MIFAPVVLLTGHEAVDCGRRALEAGADLLVPRSLAPADFLAQLHALVRLKDRQDRVGAKAAEAQRVNKRLQTTYQQIENELDLARRLQQSFLPQSLPALPEVKFAVEYVLAARLGAIFTTSSGSTSIITLLRRRRDGPRRRRQPAHDLREKECARQRHRRPKLPPGAAG